ncbi:hypothetical protein [Burkholderia contaminans]|uniref:hypothetical protein n=1 Tax=Burkholderia contaminans TaxID=488447 RepID=UPI001CF42AA7|nr:hypothetical protein [Burkholderia contaminans]MCA8102916.1 hypothetical protein [Burkholderia contaminans]
MATAAQIEAYDKADGNELFAAMDRRDAAIDARFAEHVARVKSALGLSEYFHNPEVREHVSPQDGDSVESDTRIFWGEEITPVLVGTVLREVNHMLLIVVDRSGAAPVVLEDRFDARDFI